MAEPTPTGTDDAQEGKPSAPDLDVDQTRTLRAGRSLAPIRNEVRDEKQRSLEKHGIFWENENEEAAAYHAGRVAAFNRVLDLLSRDDAGDGDQERVGVVDGTVDTSNWEGEDR